MPEFADRVFNAGLGKTKRLEQIVEALDFVADGTNVRRKQTFAFRAPNPADEELD